MSSLIPLRPEIKALLHERRFTRFLNLTRDVPRVKGGCAWCTRPGRKGLKYCSEECSDDANIRASAGALANDVFRRDQGICSECGMDCQYLLTLKRKIRRITPLYNWRMYDKQWGCWETHNYRLWEAHHIIPVSQGGGVCGLDNYATLCLKCHKQKKGK